MKSGALLCLLVLNMASLGASAQTTAEPFKYWISGGFGPASNGWISIGGNYNFGVRRYYQVGYDFSGEVFGTAGSFSVNIARGVRKFGGQQLLSAFAGPALTYGRHRGRSGEGRRYLVPSIWANLQAFAIPLSGAGLGLDVLGCLNCEQPYVGARVVLFMGNMK